MKMRIITGSTGSRHVTSDDDRQFNSGIWGNGSQVINIGECFKATLVDNNTITISDGEIVMQGCHARLNAGQSEDLTIETGTIGRNRIDLIVARYQLDTATGYESVDLEVIKGTESASTPATPAINDTKNLRNGDTILDFPLYKLTINGVNVTEVKRLFTPADSIQKQIETVYNTFTEVVVLTQAQYDAIAVKENKLYCII